MSKNKLAKARLQAKERFIYLTNALKLAIIEQDTTILTFDRNIKLNGENVKCALDEILNADGDSSTSLAHVILDENGHLFNCDDLVAENDASVNCLRKITAILQNNQTEKKLSKPILLITNDNKQTFQIRIVVFIPDEFNNNISIYFFDPFTGNRNIQKQTKNCIFLRYLIDGSIQYDLKPLINSALVEFKNDKDKRICDKVENSGWWCLLYAFLIINERNDTFLDKCGVDINQNDITNQQMGRLKCILSTHIDFISKININVNLEKQNNIETKNQQNINYSSY
jgi:hypothetical protein